MVNGCPQCSHFRSSLIQSSGIARLRDVQALLLWWLDVVCCAFVEDRPEQAIVVVSSVGSTVTVRFVKAVISSDLSF